MEFTFQVATRMTRSYPAVLTPFQCAAASCGRRRPPTACEGGAFRPFPHRIGDVTDARQQLIDYISAEAVFHGDFTLTSGKKATYYVDLRKVSLDHRVAPLIGQIMIDLIHDVPDVFAVGGMTMGADPVAAAILHQGAARGLSYDAFVVRKEPKDHGRGKQVEGPDLEGKRVIVLEDTSTTGGSPLKAIEALEKIGAVVAGVAVVVDRSTGAREVIEAAGYPYFAAIGLKDLGLD
jgi:orotate phosphoribosyltransferase